jgi:hypothetical protein
VLGGATAFDAPDAVILVFLDWRDVGLRLPKRDDFSVPPIALSSDGRYSGGERGPGSFCLDAGGLVFGKP